ncbi:DUF1015 domain-containing protein [SAR202 cluster bacterium AC-647-N09_OGT_505m]|nr:DUF1015 domain-containing protein [SAR202 cluster bacterium AC-647-N09_OGT_505m]
MADIQPFRGLRYSLAPGEDLGQLLCPPYDIISMEQQAELHQKSPYNAVRLELGMNLPTDSSDVNRYTRAAKLLEEWLSRGTLLTEQDAAFYLLQEDFLHNGRSMTRRSILARVRLEEVSKRIVLPHEETSQGPKRDRMELLTATEANLSPVMAIYRDSSGLVSALIDRVTSGPPLARAAYDDTRIQLWAVADKTTVQTVSESLKDAPIYLADGHHRYETALNYRDIQRSVGNHEEDSAHNFVLMSLIEIQDSGLLVLPYHRAIKGLSTAELEQMLGLIQETFHLRPLNARFDVPEDAISTLEEQLEMVAMNQVAIGLLEAREGRVSLLTLREPLGFPSSPLERCATQVFGRRVLEPILGTQQGAVERGILHFTHDSGEVYHLVRNGDYQLGFVLPSMSLDLFEEVVLSGERLPLKSTYFSPKLPTGLVINRLV